MLKRKLLQHEGGRISVWEMDIPLPCSHLQSGASKTCGKEAYLALVVERSSEKEGNVQVVFPYCIDHIKKVGWCKDLTYAAEKQEQRRRR